MTTKVTIDAHAGWPVEVTYIQGEPASEKHQKTEVVPAKTTKDFYIHSGLIITGIRELARDSGTAGLS